MCIGGSNINDGQPVVEERSFCYVGNMPRVAAHSSETLTDRALLRFWSHGFHATSMDDLVRATGVSRHGIYAAFGGKRELFLACFARYQDLVVSPAFQNVEHASADLKTVAAYFEYQIARGETEGLPGHGCFVANAAIEVAADDPDVLAKVREHHDRLSRGFKNAVRNSRLGAYDPRKLDAIAESIVVFATGLWTVSRIVDDGDQLRASAKIFLSLLDRAEP